MQREKIQKRLFIFSTACFAIAIICGIYLLNSSYTEYKNSKISSRIANSENIFVEYKDKNMFLSSISDSFSKNHKTIYGVAKYRYEYDFNNDSFYAVMRINGDEYKFRHEKSMIPDFKGNFMSTAYILYKIDKNNKLIVEDVVSSNELYDLYGFLERFTHGIRTEKINELVKS